VVVRLIIYHLIDSGCELKAARLSNPDFQFRWPNCSDMKNSFREEQEVIMNPGNMLYFSAGMCHSVETIEEGISINIRLMSLAYESLDGSEIESIDALPRNDKRERLMKNQTILK